MGADSLPFWTQETARPPAFTPKATRLYVSRSTRRACGEPRRDDEIIGPFRS